MKYFSLNKKAALASFEQAVVKGLAEDKGLYFPEHIRPLPNEVLNNLAAYSKEELAFMAIEQFVGDEIDHDVLKDIIEETLNFDFPVVALDDHNSSLELFHGPTMAFKDVGARFMARCLGYFNRNSDKEVTVLVATSGDTGGAVASGFLGVKNVKVVILYPSKKVSEVQEKQLTTLGQNISALEVNGTFDDCQAMVKRAFLDRDITDKKQLTSANSINVARWLPQMFYFFIAYKHLAKKHAKITFSIPSGNFGNICAGMMAKRLGLPIHQFIAATNINDIVPEFMKTGIYTPKPSQQTISNAMDVGDPSNFIRIQHLYDNSKDSLANDLVSYAFTDEETKKAMLVLKDSHDYVADPHGAVAYLGSQKYLIDNPEIHCVLLETAHPVKFLDVVEPVINEKLALPKQIEAVINLKKVSTPISDYDGLKTFLLQ